MLIEIQPGTSKTETLGDISDLESCACIFGIWQHLLLFFSEQRSVLNLLFALR